MTFGDPQAVDHEERQPRVDIANRQHQDGVIAPHRLRVGGDFFALEPPPRPQPALSSRGSTTRSVNPGLTSRTGSTKMESLLPTASGLVGIFLPSSPRPAPAPAGTQLPWVDHEERQPRVDIANRQHQDVETITY